MVHTTSRRRARNSGDGGKRHNRPLKRINLKVTVRASKRWLELSASMKGIDVEKKGDNLSFSIVAQTPEEALAKLKLLGELFSSKS